MINSGQWSGVYYLTGYAVECALKACIARKTTQDDYPDKDFVIKCYTHKLDSLVILADLNIDRLARSQTNPIFEDNWKTVKDWDEKSRYSLWTETEARRLFIATTEPTERVLPWIVTYW